MLSSFMASSTALPDTDERGSSAPGADLGWTALLLTGPVTVLVLIVLSNRGLDLTDESFYILSIADPGRYPVTDTQFGSVYHPLWLLSGGDIAVLRSLNIVLTVAIGSLASWLVLSRGHHPRVNRLPLAALSVTFGVVALMAISPWLVSPSYNTLTAQGSLLVVCGVATALRSQGRHPASWRTALLPGVLTGLGGVTVFVAKPPAAGAIGVVVLLTLLVLGPAGRRVALTSAISAIILLLVAAILIDGSVPEFVHRVADAARDDQLLGSDYSVAHMLTPQRPHASLTFLALSLGIGGFTLLGARAAVGWGARTARWQLAAALTMLVASALVVVHTPGVLAMTDSSTGLAVTFLALPAAAVLANWRAAGRERGDLPCACLLIVLPYAGAIGTNNAYWYNATLYILPLVLAGALVLLPAVRYHGPRALVALALSGLLLVVGTLGVNARAPYRQPGPIWAASVSTRIGADGQLGLDGSTAREVSSLQKAAAREGFRARTPLIDLTGESPGAAVVLGASAPGAPWLIGGYPGSDAYAARLLGRASCVELAHAWLLSAPASTRPLSATVLETFGATLDNYESRPVNSPGAAAAGQSGGWVLWRPTRPVDVGVSACERQRSEPLE